jgi:antitoxin component YwqK of YwqJK toxin-antitoxin module
MSQTIRTTLLTLTLFLGAWSSQAQFYYKDILSQQQGLRRYLLLKQHRVSQVRVNSFEGNGQPSEGFLFEQSLNAGYTQAKTRMETSFSGKMSMISYYSNGLLSKTVDSGYMTYSSFEYAYDSLQRIVRIVQVSQPLGERIKTTETHDWTYNEQGYPNRMTKVKDGKDSSIVFFTYDENGRIAEEFAEINGLRGEKTYYYYNEDGRLSDIVRYNERAKQLVADYMFDYHPDGQIRQMITLDAGSLEQGTWIYLYNEQGLSTEEKFYNAQKKLAGRMAYQYEYRK